MSKHLRWHCVQPIEMLIHKIYSADKKIKNTITVIFANVN